MSELSQPDRSAAPAPVGGECPGSSAGSSPRRHILPGVVFVAGIALSLLLFSSIRDQEWSRANYAFSQAISDRFGAVEDAAREGVVTLEALAAFHDHDDDITRHQFRHFTQPFLRWQSCIQALAWVPRVSSAERARYEADAQRDGLTDFRIVERTISGNSIPAQSRPEYFPCYIVEPQEGARRALGFDLGSSPSRREAMARACDTGQPAASERITLIRDSGNPSGFLLFLPVYRRDAALLTVEDRRRELRGFAMAVFRTEYLVGRNLEELAPAGIDTHVYDVTDPANPQYLCSHWARTRRGVLPSAVPQPGQAAEFRAETRLAVAGRSWVIICEPTPAVVQSARTWHPWGALAGGGLITTLLAGHLLSGQRRAARAQSLVARLSATNNSLSDENIERRRTEQALRASEQRFRQLIERSVDGVFLQDLNGRFVEVNARACEWLGYTRAELLAMKAGDIEAALSPETQRRIREELAATTDPAPVTVEGVHRRKDGSTYPAEVRLGRIQIGDQTLVLAVVRDITDRRRAEEALRASEERYRCLFRNMLGGFSYCQMLFEDGRPIDFVYLEVNDAFERLTGLKDVTGKRVSEAIPGLCEANPELLEAYGRVAQTGRPETFEIEVKPLGAWFSISAYSPARGFFVALFENITQRKRAEEVIRVSEERYRTLVQNVNVGIYRNTTGPTGTFIEANPAIARMFGYEQLGDFMKCRACDFYQNPAERAHFADEVARRGGVRNKELRLRKKDGTPIWASITATAHLDATGSIAWIDGVIEDITEKKAVEDALKTRLAAIDAATDMVVITDRDGTIEYVNPAFVTTTGYTAAEVLGQTLRLLKASAQDSRFYETLWQTIMAGQAWSGELINRRKDGSVYPEEMTITPVLDGAGSIIRLVAMNRDVTARRERETLARERVGLKEAVGAMEQVLGVVGHELRSPLAGIRALAEVLLLDGIEGEQQTTFIKNIHDEVVRMAGTINDLLEAARLNSGHAKWNWGTVDVATVCAEATESIAPLIDAQAISVSAQVQPGAATALGDADALRRLLVNLLGNAARHTTAGRITVQAVATERDGHVWLRLSVSDTGAGIAPEIASRLGEAFALNAGIAGSRHVTGTGLGLAICKGIAAAHGGWLTVESTVGEGATISAILRADLEGPVENTARVELIPVHTSQTRGAA